MKEALHKAIVSHVPLASITQTASSPAVFAHPARGGVTARRLVALSACFVHLVLLPRLKEALHQAIVSHVHPASTRRLLFIKVFVGRATLGVIGIHVVGVSVNLVHLVLQPVVQGSLQKVIVSHVSPASIFLYGLVMSPAAHHATKGSTLTRLVALSAILVHPGSLPRVQRALQQVTVLHVFLASMHVTGAAVFVGRAALGVTATHLVALCANPVHSLLLPLVKGALQQVIVRHVLVASMEASTCMASPFAFSARWVESAMWQVQPHATPALLAGTTVYSVARPSMIAQIVLQEGG